MSSNDLDTAEVIVYGNCHFGHLVFVPEAFALEWVWIDDVLSHARTWGEIRRTLPDLYAAALYAWERYRDDPTQDFEEEGYEDEEEEDEEQDEAYPYPPSDDAPFHIADVPPDDGADWIAPYCHDRMAWVPSEVFDRFGRVTISRANDWDFRRLVGNPEEIAAALREHGLTVREDRDLILAFNDQLDGPAYRAVLARAKARHSE
jgi:hypothetical protein